MSKEDNNLSKLPIMSHVRYVPAMGNYNPSHTYLTYTGTANRLTSGNIYKFYWAAFSPSRELPYIDIQISHDDNATIFQLDKYKLDFQKGQTKDLSTKTKT
tara:strand:+ start:425 stop:727 length:303 start_codon:yes stop_codon:yes gene_type:complete